MKFRDFSGANGLVVESKTFAVSSRFCRVLEFLFVIVHLIIILLITIKYSILKFVHT